MSLYLKIVGIRDEDMAIQSLLKVISAEDFIRFTK